MRKIFFLAGILTGAFILIPLAVSALGPDDCANGYEWKPNTGVGCVQSDCNDIADAHWSYTGTCVCGSSGSMYEDSSDPNIECHRDSDFDACPGCVYACVHIGDSCPDDEPAAPTNTNLSTNTNQSLNANTNSSNNTNSSSNTNTSTNTNTQAAATNTPSLSTQNTTGPTCETQCAKFLRGKENAEVLSAEGEPPNCKCIIDVKDDLNRLTNTISVNGDNETTLTFDPDTGRLIKKTVFNRQEEKERIRIRLGYKYTDDQIDAMLSDEKITEWFNEQMKNITTSTSIKDPQFWWQHMVAIWDHGFSGNSADFVDTYQFGRCGDSMQWLERNFLDKMDIGEDPDNPGHKHEAILSITGEKYSNMVNHTAILVRPKGISNLEWEDIVKDLKAKSGGAKSNPGIIPKDLDDIDPRLLDAKVLDPYFQKQTTVREFMKGWSYLRIS